MPETLENTLSKKEVQRLQASMHWSRDKLKPFRQKRLDIIKEFVGKHYGEGTPDKVPISYVELTINIYQQYLAGETPKALIVTQHDELKPRASDFEIAVNHLVEEIDLQQTLDLVVLDAMTGIGIVKCGLATGQTIELAGVLHDIGQPFADRVSLDDFICDMTAKTFGQCSYMGNRYRADLEEAKARYGDKLKGADAPEADTEQQAQHISAKPMNKEEFRETIELWDIYLPKDNVVAVFQADATDVISGEPLDVFEWQGPERGPYRFLSFEQVPDNIMPLPPAYMWLDMHQLANKLFNKLGRQADRQKTITGVRTGKEADGNRVKNANDGEMIPMDDPKNVQEYKFGGIDNVSFAFLLQSKDLFNYIAGNPELIGGLSPQAETLGQEELLAAGASKRVQKMRQRTIRFATEIISDMGFYLWHDPLIQLPLVKRIEGTDIEIPFVWGPEEREGDFYEYNIQVDAYSMQHRTPAERVQLIMRYFNELVAPLLPMMQMQGVIIDIETLFKTISRYSHLPELNDFLVYTNEMQPQNGPVEPRQAPVTKRINERISRSGTTRAGRDNQMAQMLLGSAAKAPTGAR